VDWQPGLCPNAEDVIPRIVSTNNMVPVDRAAETARALQTAIEITEAGEVEPLAYTDVEQRILDLVKAEGPLEPIEVIRRFDERGWEHFDEHGMWIRMENLRDRYPLKLSHAGPRKFAFHDLGR
jgi:hypothetical protein